MRPVTILFVLLLGSTVALAAIGCAEKAPVAPNRTDFIGPNVASPTPYPPAVTDAPVTLNTGNPEDMTISIDERSTQILLAAISTALIVGMLFLRSAHRSARKEDKAILKNVGGALLLAGGLAAYIGVREIDSTVFIALESVIFLSGVLGIVLELLFHHITYRWKNRQHRTWH